MGKITRYQIILTIRLAIRQLRSNQNFALSMILNMALGLTGFLVVDGFNRSFLGEIKSRTRQIAAGDLTISSRQALTQPQLRIIAAKIPTSTEISREISLVSMTTGQENSRLTEISFVDDNAPLYPGLQLKTAGTVVPHQTPPLGPREIWIYRELQSQLGISIGDRLKIGEADFKVKDIVTDDPTTGTGGFTFAPRVFARLEDLPDTKLLGVGSRSLYVAHYKFKEPTDEEALTKSLQKDLSYEAPNADIRVKSHATVTAELARVQSYLNDYLSLIALTALFLAAVGTSYLMRGHLQNTIKEFAIMSSLGASPWIAPAVFTCECVILAAGATLLSAVFATLALPVLATAMVPITGSLANLSTPISSILRTSAFATASGLILTLPQMRRLSKLTPGFLFQESAAMSGTTNLRQNLLLLPAVILWWLTAVYESKSWANGSIFAATCIVLAITLSLLALPLLRLAIAAAKIPAMNWRLSLALRLLSRNPAATISTFLALALGCTLINLIPQLKNVISREISRPDSSIPQLFMFDIQDDQVESVREFFTSCGGEVGTFHPMVRARLESINGGAIDSRKMNFEGEREQQQREALQARTQNLSYRGQLSASETVTQGTFIGESFQGSGTPALSIEEAFARRLDIKLGDTMTFDVMGVSVDGKVTSLRKVRWTSFEPNFMILVQPGVLDDAPKIWVTSASGIPSMKIDSIQAELVRLHSNISVVDIKSAVRKMLVFIDNTGVAIGVVAWLALLGGAGVLYAIAYAGSARRSRSLAILKTLGATTRDARVSIIMEYALIAVGAILFGITLGILLSWGVTVYILKAPWTIVELWSAGNGLIILPVCIMLAWLATARSAKASITSLLS